MRVVVTGAAGKLGRGLLSHLRARHPDWTIVPTDAAGELDGLRVVDVLDGSALRDVFGGADAVVHLAAIPRPVGNDPDEVMRVNVQGTHHVYRAAVDAGVGRVVLASSTAVIGTDWGRRDVPPDVVPIDEQHPCRPADPYGVSKVCAETIAAAAWRADGLSSVVLRPPWILDDADVADLRARGGGRPAGLHTYAWVHLADLAGAFDAALTAAAGFEVLFTAAPDSSLALPIADVYRQSGGASVPGLDRLGSTDAALCSARAEAVLGWRATRSWRSPTTPAAPRSR